jgi:hypothetical protein
MSSPPAKVDSASGSSVGSNPAVGADVNVNDNSTIDNVVHNAPLATAIAGKPPPNTAVTTGEFAVMDMTGEKVWLQRADVLAYANKIQATKTKSPLSCKASDEVSLGQTGGEAAENPGREKDVIAGGDPGLHDGNGVGNGNTANSNVNTEHIETEKEQHNANANQDSGITLNTNTIGTGGHTPSTSSRDISSGSENFIIDSSSDFPMEPAAGFVFDEPAEDLLADANLKGFLSPASPGFPQTDPDTTTIDAAAVRLALYDALNMQQFQSRKLPTVRMIALIWEEGGKSKEYSDGDKIPENFLMESQIRYVLKHFPNHVPERVFSPFRALADALNDTEIVKDAGYLDFLRRHDSRKAFEAELRAQGRSEEDIVQEVNARPDVDPFDEAEERRYTLEWTPEVIQGESSKYLVRYLAEIISTSFYASQVVWHSGSCKGLLQWFVRSHWEPGTYSKGIPSSEDMQIMVWQLAGMSMNAEECGVSRSTGLFVLLTGLSYRFYPKIWWELTGETELEEAASPEGVGREHEFWHSFLYLLEFTLDVLPTDASMWCLPQSIRLPFHGVESCFLNYGFDSLMVPWETVFRRMIWFKGAPDDMVARVLRMDMRVISILRSSSDECSLRTLDEMKKQAVRANTDYRNREWPTMERTTGTNVLEILQRRVKLSKHLLGMENGDVVESSGGNHANNSGGGGNYTNNEMVVEGAETMANVDPASARKNAGKLYRLVLENGALRLVTKKMGQASGFEKVRQLKCRGGKHAARGISANGSGGEPVASSARTPAGIVDPIAEQSKDSASSSSSVNTNGTSNPRNLQLNVGLLKESLLKSLNRTHLAARPLTSKRYISVRHGANRYFADCEVISEELIRTGTVEVRIVVPCLRALLRPFVVLATSLADANLGKEDGWMKFLERRNVMEARKQKSRLGQNAFEIDFFFQDAPRSQEWTEEMICEDGRCYLERYLAEMLVSRVRRPSTSSDQSESFSGLLEFVMSGYWNRVPTAEDWEMAIQYYDDKTPLPICRSSSAIFMGMIANFQLFRPGWRNLGVAGDEIQFTERFLPVVDFLASREDAVVSWCPAYTKAEDRRFSNGPAIGVDLAHSLAVAAGSASLQEFWQNISMKMLAYFEAAPVTSPMGSGEHVEEIIMGWKDDVLFKPQIAPWDSAKNRSFCIQREIANGADEAHVKKLEFRAHVGAKIMRIWEAREAGAVDESGNTDPA